MFIIIIASYKFFIKCNKCSQLVQCGCNFSPGVSGAYKLLLVYIYTLASRFISELSGVASKEKLINNHGYTSAKIAIPNSHSHREYVLCHDNPF